MIKVRVEKQIDVSPDAVWTAFSNFGNLSWYPAAEKVEAIGEGIGMIRRVHMPTGGYVDEKLETLDNERQTLSYSIEQSPVFPFDKYLALIEVTAVSPTQTLVAWNCSAEVDSMSEADGAATIEGFYRSLLDGMEAHFVGGR